MATGVSPETLKRILQLPKEEKHEAISKVYNPPEIHRRSYPSGGGGGSSSTPTVVEKKVISDEGISQATAQRITQLPQQKQELATAKLQVSQERLREIAPEQTDFQKRISETQQSPLGQPVLPEKEVRQNFMADKWGDTPIGRAWGDKRTKREKDFRGVSESAFPFIPATFFSMSSPKTAKTPEEVGELYRGYTKGRGLPFIPTKIPSLTPFMGKNVVDTKQLDIRRELTHDVDRIERTAEFHSDELKKSSERISQAERDLKGGLSESEKTDIATGAKTVQDIVSTKGTSFTVQQAQYTRESGLLKSDVEAFNVKYEGKLLPETIFLQATSEKKALETRQKGLELDYDFLTRRKGKYEDVIVGEVTRLRGLGIGTKQTKEGGLQFESKEISKAMTITPTTVKMLASIEKNVSLSKGEKSFTKAAVIGLTGGKEFATHAAGFALVGSFTPVLTGIGSGVKKLWTMGKVGKAATVGLYTGAVGAVGTGVALKGVSGYMYGKREGVAVSSAILGGFGASSQVAGAVTGGVAGMRFRYDRLASQAMEGRFTRSVYQEKTGGVARDRLTGEATRAKTIQAEHLETRFKGTTKKLDTYGFLRTKYKGSEGRGFTKIGSQFEKGKTPRGLPRQIYSKGSTIDLGSKIHAKILTQTSKGKGKIWTQQDLVIVKKLLSRTPINQRSEILKFVTHSGVEGKSVKITKVPKNLQNLFGRQESYLLQQETFKQIKPDMFFTTKQAVTYQKPFIRGDETIQRFFSLGRTRGMDIDRALSTLRKSTFISDIKSKDIFLLNVGKKGQVTLTRQLPSLQNLQNIFQPTTTVKPLVPKVSLSPILTSDTKALSMIHIGKVAPTIYKSVAAGILLPTAITTAGFIGTEQILTTTMPDIIQVPQHQIIDTQLTLQPQKISQIQIQPKSDFPPIEETQITNLTEITNITEITVPPPIEVPFLFGLPLIGLGGGLFGGKPRKTQTKPRPYRYQPSLGAIGLGLTSKKKPKGIARIFLRPIIIK